MKQGEWCRHWDVALDYCWPDNTSEGGSSTSDRGWLQATETGESETADKEELLCIIYVHKNL